MNPSSTGLALVPPALLVRDGDRALRAAAWRGALVAGVPALGLALVAPAAYRTLVPWAWKSLLAISPPLAPFLALALAFCAPALLALPIGLLAGLGARRERRSAGREQGQAAAAGAGLATTLVAFGAVLAPVAGLHDLVLRAPLLAGAALAAGVVGSLAFACLGRDEPGRRLPGAYAALVSAGAGAPILLLAGGAWALVASLAPGLSPRALAGLLAGWLPGAWVEGTAILVALAGLAPATWLTARALRRAFPGAGRAGLVLGLSFPALVPSLGVLGVLMAGGALELSSGAAMLVGAWLGAGLHAATAAVAALPGRSPPPLPAP